MHSLLEELGRKIVQNSSSKEPRKWSRLWSVEQLYDVMFENMEKHVEAIVLYYKEDEEADFEHLSKMSNLRLLISTNYIATMSGFPSCLSNKLRFVQWFRYPSKYLPSNFHPNELVELILTESNIKQLWKNKKYLPNLRTLDLRHSRNLEKIIDFGEFPNLERLDLEGCINLVELDPSIGLLRKLVYLNLKDCKSLGSIPNNIFGLSSLQYLNMCRCSKVFNNPRHLMKSGISSEKKQQHDIRESASHYLPGLKWIILAHDSSFSAPTTHTYVLPSLRSLCCLRNVDIGFCHLSHVPDAIECLQWLERLNLGGNDFVTLPSLGKLSKLEYLNLEHCKLLESLPQLPFPTTTGRDHREYDYFCDTGLLIFNCPKLGEREHCRSMTLLWMKQFIKANPRSSYEIQIVNPGSEIPSWINNQRMGDSIAIDRSPIRHDNDNNIIGIVCCAAFTMAPYLESFYTSKFMSLVFKRIDSNDRLLNMRVPVNLSLVTTKSSHLWIIYLPREYPGYSCHEFGKIDFEIFEVEGLEVESCGYRWVCKQDIQEFNLIMNHKNSLTRKCKILTIEDETQPEPQP